MIVRRRLQKRFQFLHAKTETSLWRGVNGVVKGGQLWLTGLGRGLPGDSTDKHRIKAADRLLGNEHIQSQLVAIYSGLSSCLMAGIGRPSHFNRLDGRRTSSPHAVGVTVLLRASFADTFARLSQLQSR
jgi:hypothetical protein